MNFLKLLLRKPPTDLTNISSDMHRIKKIAIIGGGVVEYDGKCFYAKASIVEYLHGFSDKFEIIHFVTNRSFSRNYTSIIDEKLVNVIVLGQTKEDSGYLDTVKNFKQHLQAFNKILDKETGVILSNLTVGGLGMIILSKLFARRVIFYLGSDPILTKKLKSHSFKGLFKRFGLTITYPLTAIISDGILTRGNACFLQSIRWNKNVINSQPLILYSKFSKINDTIFEKSEIDKPLQYLYVGHLVKNKGVHLLVEAFSRLINLKVQAKLIIVGTGSEFKELEKLAEYFGLTENIEFAGYIDEGRQLVDVYLASDVLVVPTVTSEGFPRVIDEAMACGKPVICSRLGGMDAGLSEDEVIFVTPGSSEDLFLGMYRFAREKDLQERLKKKSRIRASCIMSMTATEQHAQFLLMQLR